jgi:aminoglycoside phosphotransferase (APT) family kinase protein
MPDALPAELSAALRAAFAGRAIDDLKPLGGGLSRSMLLAFTVDGEPYVLRRCADVERAPRAIACMRIASELGVAPPLRYADERTGVAIMARVVGAPLGPSAAGDPALLKRVAATLRRLHDGPAFPPGPAAALIVRALDDRYSAAAGEELPAQLLRTVAELAGCTARYARTAPCHHDLNPNNVLVTSDRVYLVDWDTAGAGDPFIDLAQLGVFAFPTPKQRDALLDAYLGRRPTDEERARSIIARVIVLAVYAAAFLHVHAQTHRAAARAAGVPFEELLVTLGASRERAAADVVGASLLLEMQREAATSAFASAREQLA